MTEAKEQHKVLGVLPWRRPSDADAAELDPILRGLRRNRGKADVKLVQRAYQMARAGHANQFRKTGEAFISHPLAVARLLAEKGFDSSTVVAALLHDLVEDTEITLDYIESEFGEEVARVVDGVTKLDRLAFNTREAQQAATLRKMLIAMAADIRVLVIKIADRLHNMRTIDVLDDARRRQIAQETLDIYAPLAHRLGMQEFKTQLEDLSFQVLHPKRYEEIKKLVAERQPERDEFAQAVVAEVEQFLGAAKIQAEVTGRPKHLFSIYEKMLAEGKEFGEIYDLVGIRIIVDSVRDCYAALGTVHSAWHPVQGRFKDFIAMPKFNLYQSLHTTVVGPEGRAIEIQIRTGEMHRTAEYGVAAHWQYKDERRGSAISEERVWLQAMLDWQKETANPQEFLESLKVDLYQDSLFVFTPKGDVVELPAGSTPLDFAYSIHTEVGHRCIGARVDGRLVPLGSALASGSTIEIFTSHAPDAGPSEDWLRLVRTTRARNKVRQYFSRERREDAIESGRDKVAQALKRAGVRSGWAGSGSVAAEVVAEMNYASEDALFAAVGEGHVSAQSVAQRVARRLELTVEEDELDAASVAQREPLPSERVERSTSGVKVEGLDDVWVRLARCCTPLPGDEIMGFVTRGHGVSVHRTDCANAVALQGNGSSGRVIDVEWDPEGAASVVVALQIEALDRKWLLRDLTNILSSSHVNILSCNTNTGRDRIAVLRFEFELGDASHLDTVLSAVRGVPSVYDVYRVVPGSRDDG